MQEGTVAEYYDTFTVLANRVEGLSNDAMLDCFLSGLQTELQCEVIPWQPDSITKALSLAKLFEEKHAIGAKGRKIKHGFYPNYLASVKKPVPHLTRESNSINIPAPPVALSKPPVSTSTSIAPPPFRKMSYNEMQLQQEFQSLYLHAMNRRLVSGTLRFTGCINGYSVQILLDGGSDDNFIQPRVAKFLQLPVLPIEAFKVFVGNCSFLQVEGVVENLPLQVQYHIIHLSVFLLLVVGADIIIGTSWLATLGPHIVDYNAMTLQFYLNDEFITLKGDTYFKPHKSSVHQLSRLYSTKSIAVCFTLTRALQLDSITAHSSYQFAVSHTVPSTLQFSADMPVQLQKLLLQYQDVFQIPCGLPPSQNYNHKIPLLPGSTPVKDKPYRYSHSQKLEIELMVALMLQDGIIEHSQSPFSSSVLFIKKKDGAWRFCTDYRALNAITVKDSFPIPTVDEIFDELYGASYFSKLDLRYAYHQILLDQEDKDKTTFQTHHGHFQWLVMPFGLSNAPATFEALMNDVFGPALRKYVLKIEYFGHVVSKHGVKMDTSKVHAILQWDIPTTLKQLRGFLGFSGYYRIFISNYATIARPLTDLLKKDNFSQPFTIETDASGSGIGAVLSQNKHPIEFFSKKMSPRMQAQAVYTREFQLVAETFIHHVAKLHGIPKTIISDRDKAFTSKFWNHLFSRMGTTLSMSTAYHPKTDGQTESLNKCIEHYLRCFVSDNPKSWTELLPWAELSYNTSFHTSIGMKPFKVVYGCDPPGFIAYQQDAMDSPSVIELLTKRDRILQSANAKFA
ncbi:uncharacterized protein LOC120260295 [Dioscorea cayenensis subsp. rotundata]|uniref:Uncharacterized protein LOC120260295 n=1 Tax=Dioscorea cayennensis subsp. rotundata TaxID=55577 RepID=A0AB40BAI0_DIOCR|nr:uncharacterized protein LOC120260295 [Dioscorea cayenensis subsp. rotundata]